MDFELTKEQKHPKDLIRQTAKRELDLKELKELTDRALKAKGVLELKDFQHWDLPERGGRAGYKQR